jgi:glucokinase
MAVVFAAGRWKSKNTYMVIGVDLGGTKVKAGIAYNGKIQEQRGQLFKSKCSQDETLGELIGLIRSLMNPGIRGIGLGVPSVIDLEKGIVYDVVNIPSWKKVHLKDILEEEFRVPVSVNNDVNCFILGEHRFGRVKGFRTVVGITSGTGLGAGIIINNEIYYGINCGAGEIGLLSYRDHNIEYYASGNFFETQFGVTAFHAHALALEGSKEAIGYWKQFGHHIGHAIKTVMYSYDPEAVVIGGSLSKAFSLFSHSMYESLGDFTFPESVKRIKILQSVNEDITLLGAASLVQKTAAEAVNL